MASIKRNTTIDICKGIAIILMVIGHAEGPGLLMSFIYVFHMPLFFITAGYFFTQKNVDNPWDFCAKRFKGLYVPFVKWSIFFLLIHNVLFHFGILNEQYGNWSGGVTHPYTFHQALQRLVHIVFSMGGYDEFMAGAFWFFRALLVVSILYLVQYRIISGWRPQLKSTTVAAIICALALGFALLKISYGLKIATIVQGGIRETWGIFFFGMGMIYRHIEPRLKVKWWLALIFFALLITAGHFHFAGMNLSPKPIDVLTLPLTGCIGFLMTRYVAGVIDSHDGLLKRFLAHCGAMTIYIYVFHIAAFKVVSLMKIAWYGLDFGQVGCHMVIHYRHDDDLFWVLYSVAGVGLPLLWMLAYRAIASHIKAKHQLQS